MTKRFKEGDRVYHRNLQEYGTFLGYAWESDEECDVDFETENGQEQKHVSVNWLELVTDKTTQNSNVESLMTDKEFDNLTQVVTYDAWIVSTDNNGKYYVKDIYVDEIKEVILVHKEKNDINSGEDVVDFGGDYDGESDDMEWLMSFNLVR